MPSELLQRLSEVNIHVFLESYHLTNDQSEPLDFYDHPYLWDIYKDFTPKQAILKAAQIGFLTTTQILKLSGLPKTREWTLSTPSHQ